MRRGRQPVLQDAVLDGVRVRLRPQRFEDASELFPLIHGREPVLRWLIWPGPENVVELEQRFEHWVTRSDEGDNYAFVVVDRASGAACGSLVLRFLGHPFTGDLGYWIGEPFWGRGLATEAIALAGHLAFAHLATEELLAEVFIGNDASCRVLEKNGYTRDPRLYASRFSAGERDVERERWRYSLSREDFECRGLRPVIGRERVECADMP